MAGPVAVVTGAGSGIGRAAACALDARGFRLVLAGRNAESLAATAAALDGARTVPTDVTDSRSVAALFDAAVAAFGRVDVLFNNAGISLPEIAIEALAEEDCLPPCSVPDDEGTRPAGRADHQ